MNEKQALNEQQQQTLFDIAVMYSELQRLCRIRQLIVSGQGQKIFLDKELQFKNFSNWSPAEHLEWLLLQIETNCTIRPQQVDIALEMLDPASKANSVTQLNMGEGKTQVIIPMLAATISQQQVICRVVVLPQLFYTNYSMLKFKLGRLLGRAILYSPCERSKQFDDAEISRLTTFYEKIKRFRQVLMSQPDYIQSF